MTTKKCYGNVLLVSKMVVHPKQDILQWGCFSKYSQWANILLIKSCEEPIAGENSMLYLLNFLI